MCATTGRDETHRPLRDKRPKYHSITTRCARQTTSFFSTILYCASENLLLDTTTVEHMYSSSSSSTTVAAARAVAWRCRVSGMQQCVFHGIHLKMRVLMQGLQAYN